MKKRVAIIGGGISGMAAAYMLSQHAEITLFEKEARIGGHTRTLQIDYDGAKLAVDTGFIVLNNRNYPGLLALFRHLGVEIRESDMSFAVSAGHGRREWSNHTIMSLRLLLRPEWWRGVYDILRFNRNAKKWVVADPHLTLGELLSRMRFGRWFREDYLLPMAAAIWSCPAAQMLAFPARSFIQFFDHHGLLTVLRQPRWYTVTGGSQRYVEKLIAGFADHVRTDCAVASVRRTGNDVQITLANGHQESFDEVIFACHGDQAYHLLADADAQEKEILGGFQYQKNTAYLHRDSNQMPKDPAVWSSWNYHASPAENQCCVTYWMNRLQGIDTRYPVFVTLNPSAPIAPDLVFDRHEFTHPVFDGSAINAQRRITEIQGRNRVWFCGAHLGYGFHEDGLQSAIRVIKQMGVSVPWL